MILMFSKEEKLPKMKYSQAVGNYYSSDSLNKMFMFQLPTEDPEALYKKFNGDRDKIIAYLRNKVDNLNNMLDFVSYEMKQNCDDNINRIFDYMEEKYQEKDNFRKFIFSGEGTLAVKRAVWKALYNNKIRSYEEFKNYPIDSLMKLEGIGEKSREYVTNLMVAHVYKNIKEE